MSIQQYYHEIFNIERFTLAYHNYYLSEVWDVVISPNPNRYWSELSLQQCFI